MAEVQFKGKSFEVDEDGFLLHFEDWCPEWLEYVKESEGIKEIGPDHQKILDFQEHRIQTEGSLRALPLRTWQGCLQNGRPAQAHRLCVEFIFPYNKRPEFRLRSFFVP